MNPVWTAVGECLQDTEILTLHICKRTLPERALEAFPALWIISCPLQNTVAREIRIGDDLHSCFEGLSSAFKRWVLMLLSLCLWDLTACNSWWESCNMSNGLLCSEILFYGVINKMQSHSNTAFHCKNVQYNSWSKFSFNTSLWIVRYRLHKFLPKMCIDEL